MAGSYNQENIYISRQLGGIIIEGYNRYRICVSRHVDLYPGGGIITGRKFILIIIIIIIY